MEKEQLNYFHCQKERNSLKSKTRLLVNIILLLCKETESISHLAMSKDQQYLCVALKDIQEQGFMKVYDLKTKDEILIPGSKINRGKIMNFLSNHYSNSILPTSNFF